MADEDVVNETPKRARKSALTKSVEAAPTQVAEPTRRKIPGNIPYTLSPGVLKRVLDKIPTAEKPPVFNTDFLGSVLETTGGASRPIIPILKNTEMLSQSGAPTELYAQFQTEGGRPMAALEAMKNGFPEIFRRNSYAHNASDSALVDLLIAITGLTKSDRILKAMFSTFQVFQAFAKSAKPEVPATEHEDRNGSGRQEDTPSGDAAGPKPLQLVYNINVVLPETTNVEVFNAIFKSLRSNLLN